MCFHVNRFARLCERIAQVIANRMSESHVRYDSTSEES